MRHDALRVGGLVRAAHQNETYRCPNHVRHLCIWHLRSIRARAAELNSAVGSES